MFVFIRVSEVDFEEGTSTSGIVDNGSDDTFYVALSFDEVEISVSGGCNSFGFGSGVDTANFAFSLGTNDFTHE